MYTTRQHINCTQQGNTYKLYINQVAFSKLQQYCMFIKINNFVVVYFPGPLFLSVVFLFPTTQARSLLLAISKSNAYYSSITSINWTSFFVVLEAPPFLAFGNMPLILGVKPVSLRLLLLLLLLLLPTPPSLPPSTRTVSSIFSIFSASDNGTVAMSISMYGCSSSEI